MGRLLSISDSLGRDWMSRLTIYPYNTDEPVTLSPGEVFRLNRRFVTGGLADTTVSARHPPQVFFAEGEWMIRNDPSNKVIVIHAPDGRPANIGPGAARTLAVGDSQVFIAGYRVGLSVEEDGSTNLAFLSSVEPDEVTEITLADGAEEEERLKALLQNKPMWRTIMFTRLQRYISPNPKPGENPSPLTAAEVLKCYPDPRLETTVNQAWRDVKDITGLALNEIGPWLVERGLLLTDHNVDIPHVNCGHRPQRGGR
jgi:hypothetical protein